MSSETVTHTPTAAHASSEASDGDRALDRTADTARANELWSAMALVGLAAFVVFTVLLLNHVTIPFDKPLLAAARPLVGDGTIWRILSESANIPLIVIGVGMVLVLFFVGRRREAILVAIALIAITAGSEGVKQLVARPRPEGTDPNIPGVVYSFPSGHVLEALAIFGIIAIHVVRSRVARPVAALVVIAVLVDVFLVGLSRVILNAHWPSDAVASAFAAAGVLGIYGRLTADGAWASKRSPRLGHRNPGRRPEADHGAATAR
jgi:undecaprenyl-diphosphatase